MSCSDKSLSPFAAPSETRSSFRQALPQILAVCVKNVLLLGFGMTLGFPTILIPSLSGRDPNEPISLGQEAISWIGSINLICVPVGCLLSGAITQPIGRKRAMQLVNIPFVIAWLLFYFSNDVWQIFLALCITGVTGGLLEAPVLTYVAEITQPHLRGMLSSTSTMAIILGILSQFLLGTFFKWRLVSLLNCILPILAFTLLIFVPETPIWLITKNRYLDARKSIAWLRGWTSLNEIELEFQELCKQLGKANDIGIDNPTTSVTPELSKIEYLKLFTKKNFLWPYFLVALTFFLGHFSGMATLQTYAIKLFATLKSPIDKYYATVILGIVELLGCVACVTLVHFIGKRVINFISLIGSGCCFFIVATYAYVIDVKYLEAPSEQIYSYNWIPTFFLISSAFLSHVGIRILPWILTGEVFPNEIRATASGLAGAIGYIFGFLANKIFLSMISILTLPGTFWFNAAVSFVGVVLLYFLLPETEGKTLHDITEHFSGVSKLDNKVKRNGIDNKAFELEESRV
ncbi:Sugar tr and/or MFS 1 domain containing protein [Asbolus verrucosus]|uniref:Sugar tr and/or MFS 1 domain containing protein n=1 Tax=Asbolus verrucosus TaxID=1661398 RepID=A0A482VNE6_ASBVE|nr:Sugar tr and/or MFS 1 domain containing protein [Asbolus verrucosus]